MDVPDTLSLIHLATLSILAYCCSNVSLHKDLLFKPVMMPSMTEGQEELQWMTASCSNHLSMSCNKIVQQ